MTLLQENSKTLQLAVVIALWAGFGSALAEPPDGERRNRGIDPVAVTGRTLPAGLQGDLPPGHGGPVPGLARRPFECPVGDDDEEAARESLFDLCPGSTIFGPLGRAGVSHVAHVDFAAVDAIDGSPIVVDPATARMMYFWIGSRFDFVLNAHGLVPDSEWTLVHEFDGEAGATTAICFASATVNAEGDLHLLASVDPESHLPVDLDPFADPADGDQATLDAQLTLLPAVQVDCDTGTVLPPPADDAEPKPNLVSQTGIRFVDVDILVCPEDGA